MSQVLLPVTESGTLFFRCNICGANCDTLLDQLERETRSCASCGSTPRYRAVIRALTLALFRKPVALPDMERHQEITGLGLTDWDNYAAKLAEKFAYQNTFYHQEPRLDISDPAIAPHLISSQDFIISSDVFEHVAPPVDKAFRNAWMILKPRGVLVLTVPYGLQTETIEHFPDLNDYGLVNQEGSYLLRNVTAAGETQEFRKLVFHGGPGTTLEMRVFARDDLLHRLRQAGFDEVYIHHTPDFAHGVWWPEPWSLPVTARKPVGGSKDETT
jgi:SAM-dependent methyltransferase